VTIDTTKNTLAGIRDAINAALDNKGVRAAIINSTGGAVLTLTSTNTGLAKALRVTQSGGDGGLAALVYDPGVTTNLTEVAPARDASIKVEGFSATSAGNSFANVIDGVTINVVAAEPGTIKTLTVSNDNSAAVDNVKKFVQDFNAAVATMSQLRRYNPTTKDAGPLLGDAMLRGIEANLRGMIADKVPGATTPYDSLSSIGITTQLDGTMRLDESKLSSALGASFDAVGKLFGLAAGVGAKMHTYLDTQLKSDAVISTRTDGLNGQRRLNDRERDVLEARMKSVEQRYRKQFSSLDTVLAGLQQTSAFLTQRLGVGN
jgi:flagellar hook-associated protein 2